MTLLHTLAVFFLALGVLISFHEYGHYLAARLCGVKVLRFCLGFGKPFISRRFGPDQTEWGLAPFPIGGYVKLLGETPISLGGDSNFVLVQDPDGTFVELIGPME